MLCRLRGKLGSGYLAQCPATREQPEQQRSPSNRAVYHDVAGTEGE